MGSKTDQFRVDELYERGEQMSAWECDFVRNVAIRLRDGYPLTGKQSTALEKIHANRVRHQL